MTDRARDHPAQRIMSCDPRFFKVDLRTFLQVREISEGESLCLFQRENEQEFTFSDTANLRVGHDNFPGSDVGKAVCRYTYMRQRDALGDWEPYALEPQWVRVFGGQYNTKASGSVCVAFELLRKRDAPELPAANMWPRDELLYQPSIDFCRMKRCTLHVSLLGLRDMKPISSLGGLLSSAPSNPVVEVRVRMLLSPEEALRMTKQGSSSKGSSSFKGVKSGGAGEHTQFWQSFFWYVDLKPGGDPNNPADRNKKWESGGGTRSEIFEKFVDTNYPFHFSART